MNFVFEKSADSKALQKRSLSLAVASLDNSPIVRCTKSSDVGNPPGRIVDSFSAISPKLTRGFPTMTA